MADYMVPSAFVMMDAYPLTPNGKVNRKALPAPDLSAVAARAYEAPQGALETAIAAIWQELLGLAQVGRQSHFFELGGHSLLAIRLVARMRKELGVEVALRDLFANPVLSVFAALAAKAGASTASVIVAADRNAPLPLSWAQQRLWFLDQLDGAASAAYHIPAALRLSGTLDSAALQAALDRIVARHENLRTTFVDGQQVIAAADCGFALRRVDLSGFDSAAQAATLERLSNEEAAAPFDLAQGPLIRGQLLRLSDAEHILLVTQHHIISDGWSIGLLVDEVRTLYTAFQSGARRSAGATGAAICRLCGLAARLAAGRSPGTPERLLERPPGRCA
ncbi:condensation domain-containing protein [Massilia sp. B-10]|nr:condensation domain-containing protein [Massilia sp. B-10]